MTVEDSRGTQNKIDADQYAGIDALHHSPKQMGSKRR
jgi:hypothetical protein